MGFVNKLDPKNIIAIDVFLENRKTRTYVGRLDKRKTVTNSNKDLSEYVFEYDQKYLYKKPNLPLGPDILLTKKMHTSSALFKSLNDRIPSSSNPYYKKYCETEGIDPNEKNSIILLATIGRRGPSSFVFEPVYKDEVTLENVKQYRHELGMTLREFSWVFDISPVTIQKMERKTNNLDSTKRIMVYYKFPEVALFEVQKNGGILNSEKKQKVLEILKNKCKEKKIAS